jgi:hypothetical protein
LCKDDAVNDKFLRDIEVDDALVDGDFAKLKTIEEEDNRGSLMR